MTRVLTPVEAGRYDPPMQEWLALPVGLGPEGTVCPSCESTHFGTANPLGYFHVRVCHDERRLDCRAEFRAPVTPRLVWEIVGALTGEPRRLGG